MLTGFTIVPIGLYNKIAQQEANGLSQGCDLKRKRLLIWYENIKEIYISPFNGIRGGHYYV